MTEELRVLAPVLLNPRDVGSTLYSCLPAKLNVQAWRFFGKMLLLFLPLPLLIAVSGHADKGSLLIAAGIVIAGPSTIMVLLLAARVRVCERGLVVENRCLRKYKFVIPYLTIDPASVMVHWDMERGGAYRYKGLTALQGYYPWPEMARCVLVSLSDRPWYSWIRLRPNRPGSPLNVWGAPYSRHGISFRALHPVFASPRYRPRLVSQGILSRRAAAVLAAWADASTVPALKPVLYYYHGSPVMRWMISTDRPDELLRQIEKAMLAAGVVDAAGFADRGLAAPYDQPPYTIPSDPGLW